MKRVRPIIIANWKLYLEEKQDIESCVKTLARKVVKIPADIIICPPAPFISTVLRLAGKARLSVGAQAVSAKTGEKSTGEVSARALASAGASYAIVGHSERRAMGESDEDIRLQIENALAAKLSVVVCVGEDERDSSGSHFAAIEAQLRASLPKLSAKEAKSLSIAYEPVWAIGKTAADAMTPDDLEETAIYLRKVLADLIGRKQALLTPILYGGSVEPDNAHYLMHAGVNGFLVGHASVDPSSLISIAKSASATK